MERRAVIISVNDTLRPRTGREYVFRVIKTELLRLGYQTREFSVPNLIRRLEAGLNMGNFDVFLRFLSHMFYSLPSIYERYHDSALVITSASPAFPAFGHIVYHQPKAGMRCSDIEAFLSPYMRLGVSVLENERISPLAFG